MRLPGCLLLLAGILAIDSPEAEGVAAAAKGEVLVLDIKGGIGPATRDYVRGGLEQAAAERASAVVLRIDTPGGLDAAMRDINQAILDSATPVIGWVAPAGARAASAGTYILYACHVAAMAPATELGAATPVSIGGGSPEPEPDKPPRGADQTRDGKHPQSADAHEPATLKHKVVNDAAAYLRSLAELRGRNAQFAEAAVRDAATLTAGQALEQQVIEIIAADLPALLRQADGREVKLAHGPAALATAQASVREVAPDWRARLLGVLTEPTVAYLLLLAGLYGLVIEAYAPGMLFPGVTGALCLLLALYALQVLPVNFAGVALIVLGVVLMAAEFALPTYGSLGIGGVAALLIGSLILFDTGTPGFGVSGQLILGVACASAAGFLGLAWLALRARRRPIVTGLEELVGRQAIVLTDFRGRGQVRIRGEIWQATSAVPLDQGAVVRVEAVDGLVLRVAPLADGDIRTVRLD